MQEAKAHLQARAVAALGVEARAHFIRMTYMHLLGAITLFTFLQIGYFTSGLAESIAKTLVGSGSGMRWLMVIGAFAVVGWFATRTAHKTESKPLAYAALVGFVFAESIIFVPILYIANQFAPGAINNAVWATAGGFTILTAIVFYTGKDFSFLRGILFWGGACALMLIVGGAVFGMNLGTWFSVGMVGFAGASILYDTSNIIHHYPEDRYVGAALELFASVALLFWYVLQLFMSRD